MKHILRNTAYAVLISMCWVFTSCLDDEIDYSEKHSEGGPVPSNEVIDARLFEVINLDYPGLEQAKAYYEQDKYYFAAQEIMDYFRNRTERVNPDINLFNVKASDNDVAFAKHALKDNKYRFYVPNFFEDVKKQTPYSYMNEDKTINWQFWPTKQNEQRFQLHRHYWFEMQARVFRTTGDEKYAEEWMAVYADWLKQNPRPTIDLDYGQDPSHQTPEYQNAGFAWRPLEVAHRVEQQLTFMEYFSTSTSLTPEWYSTFLVAFADQVNHIIKFMTPHGNHRVTQASAVFYAGVLCPEFKDAETWAQTGSKVLDEEVVNQFHDDGMLKELDLGYHVAEINDFLRGMRLSNVNNLNAFSDTYMNQVPKMISVVMDLTYPDYTIPTMNDTRTEGKQSVMHRNFGHYLEFFPDDKGLEWRATKGASGQVPQHLSAIYPTSGYYVLRTGWDTKDQMMVLKNGPRGSEGNYHNQPDNGTFELYINGRQFFPDAGCYAYSGDAATNFNRAWFRQTYMHNTMTRGRQSTSSAELQKNDIKHQNGRLLLFQEAQMVGDKKFDILVTENQGYDDLKHRRAVFFAKDLIVLLDEGVGDTAVPVNLNYHFSTGQADAQVDAAQHMTKTLFKDGNNLTLRVFSPSALTSFLIESQHSVNIGRKTKRWGQCTTIEKGANEVARFVTVITAGDLAAATVEASIVGDYSATGAQCVVKVNGVEYALNYNL